MASRVTKRRANRNPLRKITGWMQRNGRVFDVLECGHDQPEKCDAYGPTNAARRRCRQCGRAASAAHGGKA